MENKLWLAGAIILGILVLWLGGGALIDFVADLFQNPEYRTVKPTEPENKFNYFE
jgi:hypothetical protein